jgi:hypothetical protein
MTSNAPVDRGWIAAELARLTAAERSMAVEMKTRADAPPDPSLSVMYHEMAADDERHAIALETIATRYGHTPSRTEGMGVGETLGRIKDRVAALGVSRVDRLAHDLNAKSDVLYRETAWTGVLRAIGDGESSGGMAALVAEDQKHRDALLKTLQRLLAEEAHGNHL